MGNSISIIYMIFFTHFWSLLSSSACLSLSSSPSPHLSSPTIRIFIWRNRFTRPREHNCCDSNLIIWCHNADKLLDTSGEIVYVSGFDKRKIDQFALFPIDFCHNLIRNVYIILTNQFGSVIDCLVFVSLQPIIGEAYFSQFSYDFFDNGR